jgi:hypothetical protein
MTEQSTPENNQQETTDKGRTIVEEIEIASAQLLDRVKELIAEGNVRRLIIRSPEDKVLLEIPLTVGVVAGGIFTIVAPFLAALGGIAALVSRVKVQIIRDEPPAE